jgi:hypothetical protein
VFVIHEAIFDRLSVIDAPAIGLGTVGLGTVVRRKSTLSSNVWVVIGFNRISFFSLVGAHYEPRHSTALLFGPPGKPVRTRGA